MPDSAERFIEAAVRPLEDNAELQIAARWELQAIVRQNPDADRSLEEGASRLEEADLQAHSLRRLGILVMIALSMGLVLASGFQFFTHWHSVRFLAQTNPFLLWQPPEAIVAPKASPRERLLLFGDSSKSDPSERMKGLWDSEPSNPAFFAEYTFAHIQELAMLPPGFLETAARLDPDNGFFPALAACVTSKNLATRIRTSGPRMPKDAPQPVPSWTIEDPAGMADALALLEQAAKSPKWDSYRASTLLDRYRALPEPSDSLERIPQMLYMVGHPYIYFHALELSKVVSAEAERCAKDGDREGFLRLLATWETVAPRLLGDQPLTLLSSMVARASMAVTIANLLPAAETLGHTEIANRLRSLRDDLEEILRQRNERASDPGVETRRTVIQAHGSRMMLPASLEAYSLEVISREDLAPGRLADHELANRTIALCAWAILSLAALLAWSYRFRGGLLARRLSLNLSALLRPIDWAWIIGGGIGAPFVFFHAVARLTPLGGRDWGTGFHGMIVPLGQWISTTLLMLGLPLILARWRLGLRGAGLGLHSGGQWMGKAWIMLCVAAFLLFGIAPLLSNNPLFHNGSSMEMHPFLNINIHLLDGPGMMPAYAAILLLAAALGWCLLTGIATIAGKPAKMLRRVILSRMLVPAYASGMLLTAAAMPVHHAMERHWIARDHLLALAPESPSITRHEYLITQAMRQELLEILDAKP